MIAPLKHYTLPKSAYSFFIKDKFFKNNIVFIAKDDKDADNLYYNVRELLKDRNVLYLPADDTIYYNTVSPSKQVVAEKVNVLSLLASNNKDTVLITSVKAVFKRIAPVSFFKENSLKISLNKEIQREDLLKFFIKSGFSKTDQVYEKGEFAVRGDIIDVFPIDNENPLRIDFFDNTVERIRVFDAVSQTSVGVIGSYEFLPVSEFSFDDATISLFRTKYREHFGPAKDDPLYESISSKRQFQGIENFLPLFHDGLATIFDFLPKDTKIISFNDIKEFSEDIEADIKENYTARFEENKITLEPSELYITSNYIVSKVTDIFTDFDYPESKTEYKIGEKFTDSKVDKSKDIFIDVIKYIEKSKNPVITAFSKGSMNRLQNIFKEKGLKLFEFENFLKIDKYPAITVMDIDCGFKSKNLTLITEEDILGERLQKQPKIKKQGKFIKDISSLEAGDIIVHLLHGIGRYEGLETLKLSDVVHECLKLTYYGGDKLYVPVENIEVLSKYGSDSENIVLDKLGSTAWQARKARLKKKILEIAEGLIKIAALRKMKSGEVINNENGSYEEFCSLFPYVETSDQLNAINDVISDLSSGKPMDRLICGDVGFGKTEVALRSAFVTANSGFQVAIVVPTTLLARQHYETFVDRFKRFPLKIRQLSRLVSAKDTALTYKEIENGSADIVIGTHALLSSKVKFKNLALLIVDEEQHFGVKHKEKIKELKANVHVLTLTATPIPRTLQLSLTGVKDLSIIATPPIDRQAVATIITPFDNVAIRAAIMKEFNRGGQVFYVCPKIADMPNLIKKLGEIVPEIKIVVAHGQMSASQIEKNVMDFSNKKYDLLLSTSIIESGIDMPLVNTLIVHRSDMFGLSGLYQLRGRVGRGKIKGYAYFTVEKGKILSKTAIKRLNVIKSLDSLGAGFTLASHDMDIRGAGNILGDEQSGFVKEVGIELYQQMLEETIMKLKSGEGEVQIEEDNYIPSLNLGVSILIPESYISDLNVKLEFYRRISSVNNKEDMNSLIAEMIDRFGDIPDEVQNLFNIVDLKVLCRKANIEKIDAGNKGLLITFYKNTFNNPLGLVDLINKSKAIKLRQDQKINIQKEFKDINEIIPFTKKVLQEFVKIANAVNE